MPTWDPDIYNRYQSYRDRPALDLLLQLPSGLEPKEIWDLGCGTGEHAALLARRHPEARVHGLDSSLDMLAKARARTEAVDWVLGDVAGFAPDAAPDLIFTSSTLHWLPDHERLFPALAGKLARGGVFACQIPAAHETRHHEILRRVAMSGPWAGRLATAGVIAPTASFAEYYEWLAPVCGEIDIWATTYLHVLQGDNPVVDWMRGTALRPYLDALAEGADRDGFMAAFSQAIAEAFPAREDGLTLFPFPRLFMIARL